MCPLLECVPSIETFNFNIEFASAFWNTCVKKQLHHFKGRLYLCRSSERKRESHDGGIQQQSKYIRTAKRASGTCSKLQFATNKCRTQSLFHPLQLRVQTYWQARTRGCKIHHGHQYFKKAFSERQWQCVWLTSQAERQSISWMCLATHE